MIGTPYALALATVIGLAAGWTTHGWLTDSRELERINAKQIAEDAANRAARNIRNESSWNLCIGSPTVRITPCRKSHCPPK